MSVEVIPVLKTFKFDIGGKIYDVIEPNVEQLESFQALSKNNDEGSQVKVLMQMFEELGLPKEVTKVIGLSGIKKLSEVIMSADLDTKKKIDANLEKIIRVAKFYNWTLAEVRKMRVSEFKSCFNMITQLQAEKTLLDLSVSQYPHSTEKFRKQLHKEIVTAARPHDPDAPALSTADLANILASGGAHGRS